jgi:hypothetical protein
VKDADDPLRNPTNFRGPQGLKKSCNECRVFHLAHCTLSK